MSQFYIIIFVILLNGIIWVFKQLAKQKALKDARAAEERRQTELLRTGKPIPLHTPRQFPPQPKPKLETLAERQERLRQLRSESALPPPPGPRPAAQPRPPSPSRPITRELWPGGPVVVIGQAGAPAMPRPAQQRSMPVPQQRQQRQQPQPVPALPARPVQKTKKPRPAPGAPAIASFVSAPRAAPTAERYRMGQGIGIDRTGDPQQPPLPRTPDDWRRAFIASEIFRPPVALRTVDPGQLHV